MQDEFLNSPIQELRDIKNILGRARDLVNPSKLLELVSRVAEHAEDFAVEGELIDAPWVRIRGVQHLTRTGRDANRPRRARRLGKRRACRFELRNVRSWPGLWRGSPHDISHLPSLSAFATRELMYPSLM